MQTFIVPDIILIILINTVYMEKNKSKLVVIALFFLIIIVGGVLLLSNKDSLDEPEVANSNESQTSTETDSTKKCFASALTVDDLGFLSSTIMLPKEDYFIEDVRSDYTFKEIKNGAFGMQYLPSQGSYYLAYELCAADRDESLSNKGLDEGDFDKYNVSEAPEYGNSITTSFVYQKGDDIEYTIESGKGYILYILYSTDGDNWMVDSAHDFSVK